MPKFEFDEPCAIWTAKLVDKYLWGVSPHYEACDLYQECYLKFLKIIDGRYDIENQRHGMSLYMTAAVNRMNDLFKRCRKRITTESELEEYEDGWSRLDAAIDDPDDRFAAFFLLEEMSPPLQRLFERSSWEQNIRRVRRNLVNSNGQRETTNQFLCRLAGVDANVYDLRGELQEFVAI